nr:hypothetical protein [Tanacetum cinerariifolium]
MPPTPNLSFTGLDEFVKKHVVETYYEEIDGGYVAFRGNPKGGKITRKGSGPDWLFDIDALTRTMNYEPIIAGTQSNGYADPNIQVMMERRLIKIQEKKINVMIKKRKIMLTGLIMFVSSTVNTAGSNEDNELPFDPNMPALEDVSIFSWSSDDEDDGAVADMNNLDTTIQVSTIPTTRIYKDHPLDQVIEDLQSATQTRKMSKNLRNIDPRWIEAMQEELLQFKLQEVWTLMELPNGKKATGTKWVNRSQDYKHTMETQKPLLKDQDGKEVDVHTYRLMIGSLMYLTSSRPDIMFAWLQIPQQKLNMWLLQIAVDKCFGFKINYLIIDGKEIVITESSVRRHLQLADEEGIECLPNSTIFEPLALMGKPNRKDTQVPQPSGPTNNVANEVVHKELGDRLVRAATTASSLEVEQDNESSRDEESLGKDASKQGRRIDAIDVDEDITLVNDADNEMFDVDDLGGEEVFLVGQNENVVEEIVDAAQVSTVATTVTITTEEITLAQALEALKTLKTKVKGIVFQEPCKSTTTTISSQQSQDKGKGIMIEEPMKPKKKDQIRLDKEAALKLQAELNEEERLARERES